MPVHQKLALFMLQNFDMKP